MKLSLKMFFGICIPAVISCLVIAAFLIEKNLDENIDAEIQIAIKNVEKIENRIKYNVNSTILFKSAEKSNTEKNVKIYYYNNNQLECYNHMQMNLKQQKITNILLNKRKLMIKIIYLYQQRWGKIKQLYI